MLQEMKDVDGESNIYSLHKLTQVFDPRDVMLILSIEYELFFIDLLNSDDKIVVTITNIMTLINDMVMYINIIACGDSMCIEVILNEWLLLQKAGGKPHYTNLTMTNMEILHGELTSVDLEGMWINPCVRRKQSKHDGNG